MLSKKKWVNIIKQPMKILIIITCCFFISAKRNHEEKIVANECQENKNVYEEFLMPRNTDSINYEPLLERYKSAQLPSWLYEMIPYSRGLIDTSLLAPAHFDKFNYINHDYKLEIIECPLIVEGEVINTSYADTTKFCTLTFATTIAIKITDIIKSKYNIHVDDTVWAKTNLYGYYKLPKDNTVVFSSFWGPYKKGKKYLFCLNKYFYMSIIYKQTLLKKANTDVYCPTAFMLDINATQLSTDYEDNLINRNTIISFLKK